MLKCKGCGYAKNKPGQQLCNLCQQPLKNAEWVSAGGPKMGIGTEPREVTFGADRGAARGASKAVATKADGPSQDQIVYAGDFAIVYVFALTSGGMVILKPGEVFTFGRGDNADHKIDSKAVSRRHARIHWAGVDPPSPEIVDLESKNGISVNGVPVTRKALDDGDIVAIGPFTATLRVLSANDDLESQMTTDRLSGTTVSVQRLSGEVRLISIPWLLGHLEKQKESGTLTVHDKDEQGFVALISGVAIAAGYGKDSERTGEEAIRAVAKIRGGRFAFSPHAEHPPQSIGKTLKEILAPPGRRRPPPPRGRRPPPQRR